MRRLFVATVLLTFGCSDATDRSARTEPTVESAPPASTITTPADAPDTDDDQLRSEPPPIELPAGGPIVDGVANSLIIVFDRDAGADALGSYRADGTLVATYSTDPNETIQQPIWAPNGRRVAWTQSVDDGSSWELVTSDVGGGDRTTHALPGRPDYISYDPTSSRVLALTPSPEGFGLVIVEVARADTPFTVVDLGRPYFSDFAPAGDRLIAHVAANMRVVGVDGGVEPLDVVSITHQTPAWHPTESRVFYTTDTGDGPRIVSHDLDTDTVTELASGANFVFFDLDASGERLAVAAFDNNVSTGGLDAFRRAPVRDLSTGLWIVDADDGTTTLLSGRPASAPMWDPSGAKVLVRDRLNGSGTWRVYDVDGNVGATEEFNVDTSLLPAYLPFWDQYERSQTLWSPDGRSFVHAGTTSDGEQGIWVHEAATTGPSTFLVPGDIAFWSPT